MTGALPDISNIPPCYDPEKAINELNALTSEQVHKLGLGVAIVSSSKEADEHFEKASSAAATAVQNIDTMFVNLIYELTQLGSVSDTKDLLTKLGVIQKVRISATDV